MTAKRNTDTATPVNLEATALKIEFFATLPAAYAALHAHSQHEMMGEIRDLGRRLGNEITKDLAIPKLPGPQPE